MKNDEGIAVIKLRFDHKDRTFKERVTVEPFLKGPIKLSWLSKAAALPGKTLNVALAIRWISGMSPPGPLKLTRRSLQTFSVSRDAVYDALGRMEAAGLIKRTQKRGQSDLIEVVEAILIKKSEAVIASRGPRALRRSSPRSELVSRLRS